MGDMAKELDKSRWKRLITIDGILHGSEEGVTMAELIDKITETTGVPTNRHVVKRDIKALRSLGAKVDEKDDKVKDPKNNQERNVTRYSYKNPSTSLFQVSLTEEERKFIGQALEVLGLKGLVVMKLFKGLDLKTSGRKTDFKISFTMNPKEKFIGKWIDELYKYIHGKGVIHLKMQDRKPPYAKIMHTVHPWYLREYNRRWYLFGWNEETQEIMHYSLDRIVSIKERSDIAYRRPFMSITEILKDVVGVSMPKADPIDVRFWVSDESADFVEKKPIHHTQEVLSKEKMEEAIGRTLDLKGGKYFTIRCKDNYELRREMTSFGTALLVLGPEELRSKLKTQLQKMYEMYC